MRRIIREHGGEIDIQSREGQGTKVSVVLPLVEKEDAARAGEATRQADYSPQ